MPSSPNRRYVFRLYRPSLYLNNSLNNFDKSWLEYSLAPTDDLIRLWRSTVKVTAGRRGRRWLTLFCCCVNNCARCLLQAGPSARSLTASSSVPSSFRELMERRAEENNIVFVPVPNRTQEGKQVYRFGRLHIYVDRGVIFALNGSMWSPVSLNSLVEMAR